MQKRSGVEGLVQLSGEHVRLTSEVELRLGNHSSRRRLVQSRDRLLLLLLLLTGLNLWIDTGVRGVEPHHLALEWHLGGPRRRCNLQSPVATRPYRMDTQLNYNPIQIDYHNSTPLQSLSFYVYRGFGGANAMRVESYCHLLE